MERPCRVRHPNIDAPDVCPEDCLAFQIWKDPARRARHEQALTAVADPVAPRSICLYLDEKPTDQRDCNCPRRWVHPCERYGHCVRDDDGNDLQLPSCNTCPSHVARDGGIEPDHEPIPVLFQTVHAPGDAVVAEAAIASLHARHPGKYLTDVEGVAGEIWDYHPLIRRLTGPVRERAIVVPLQYPLVDFSNARPVHFMQAYCEHLEWRLGVPVPLTVAHPRLYLSGEERSWVSQVQELLGKPTRYVIVNAGHKNDFTAKWWGTANYQAVVNRLKGRVVFVQVGEVGHNHPALADVVDLRGKTDTRQLVRLVYNAVGAIGPSTFLQHLCAALERPYVLLAGGREPVAWQHYPRQTTFSQIGRLGCCAAGACWKSRTVKRNDDAKEDDSLCDNPTPTIDGFIPACLQRIRPEDVADAVADFYHLPGLR